MRLFINVFHPDEYIALVIATLGGVSMFVGALLAVGALDVKRLLAYSSISQVGYVVMGLGLGMTVIAKGEDASAAALTFTGALFHMFNHSVFKGLLFLNAGSVEYATGARNMKQMGGLAKYMPVTFASTFVASMSIVGIPPFNGFFSKLLIIVAAINGEYYFRAALGIIVGVITLVTFVKFQVYTFYGKPAFVSDFGESPTFMKISMISLVVLCFVLSILIIPEVRSLVIDPALDTLLETNGYSTKMPGS